MKTIITAAMLCLASCSAAPCEKDAAAIADLQNRVAALEKGADAKADADAAKKVELVAPGLGSDRRFYPNDAKCQEARNQLLNDAANRAAAIEGNAPRRIVIAPPFVSCVPA